MDADLFVSFLHHFSEFVEEKGITKPVLLFVDGHSTHVSRTASTFCAENGIVLYCLLANATHILQPCDVGFFSPLKSAWKKQVKLWQIDNIGEALTKRNFPGVFKAAWDTVATFENAAHGFRRTGLFPLSADAIDLSKLEPSKVANPSRSASSTEVHPSTSEIDQQPAEDTAVSIPTGGTTSLSANTSASLPNDTGHDVSQSPSVVSQHVSVNPQSTPTVVSSRESFVSPAFNKLTVPESKNKKTGRRFEKMPKALSGTKALKIFEERDAKKKAELLEKIKRKEEREKKKVQKEQLKEQKQKEREEKKQRRNETKLEKKRKRQTRESSSSASSSDNENVKVQFMDSDEAVDETKMCPGCKTSDDGEDNDDWVKCSKCPRQWHVLCTGDALLLEIPADQINNYPFHCEFCL